MLCMGNALQAECMVIRGNKGRLFADVQCLWAILVTPQRSGLMGIIWPFSCVEAQATNGGR